jgi:HemY protein
VLWLLVWGIKLLVELVTASTGLVNPWSRRNRSRRVQIAIEQGQMDLAEGRWASAQKHLARAAEAEPQPLLYYLGAARAANEQGHYEESDNLLERALERQPQAELAIALSHAQLQVDRADTDGALATLQAMHERHPHNVPGTASVAAPAPAAWRLDGVDPPAAGAAQGQGIAGQGTGRAGSVAPGART